MNTSTARWVDDAIFSQAWAYDLAFAWDVERELRIVSELALLKPGMRVLIPACGTGRHALALAERGYRVEASDIHPGMVGLAQAERLHPQLSYSCHDMCALPPGPLCQAAFCFCNSFRYLLEEGSARAHLRSIHARLEPGANYLVELGLNNAADKVGSGQGWRMLHEDCRVSARWTLQAVHGDNSVETAQIKVEYPDGRVREFSEEQPQRLWSHTRLVEVAREEGFAVTGTYLTDGSAVAECTQSNRYYVVLRRS